MNERRAACSCGYFAVVCGGDPVRVSICHCLACQRRTGSVFGAQARFRADQIVHQEGTPSTYVRIGDAGSTITFQFCPKCASTVCWTIDAVPGFVAVAVGAFADPTFPAPTVSIYEARRHPWVALPDTVVDPMD